MWSAWKIGWASAGLAATFLSIMSDAAAAVEDNAAVRDFYQGRQLDLVIGSAPGGGYDTYARLVARHMGKYIPGNPGLIAKNLPGAGSARAASHIFNVAPKDGTAFGAVFSGALVDPLFTPEKRKQYDPTKFFYLGSANNEVGTCMMWHTAPVKTLDEAFEHEVILGASATGGTSRDFAAALINVLGAKFKVVSGYEGSKDMMLALERGEIQGICGHLWSSVIATNADWLRDKKIFFWTQMALQPHPDMGNVPPIWNYVKTDGDRRVLELIFGQLMFGRPYMAPPDIPADRARALRAAFEATMADGEYKAEAQRALLETQSVTGAQVQDLISTMFAADPQIIKAAAEAQILKKN